MTESIREILSAASNPVIAWSGGRDSTVLLSLARKIKDIPIVWFRQNVSQAWRQWCESIIMEWDLTVFVYPSSDTYYLPNDQGLTLIDEYSLGTVRIPVLQDVVPSGVKECGANVVTESVGVFPYPWTETLTGYRDSDRHFILGQDFFPEDGTQLGDTKLYAPIRDWSDADIAKVYETLGLPPMPDERLPRCVSCLEQGEGDVYCHEVDAIIPRLPWERALALNNFRARFVPQFQNSGLSPQGV